jgi:DNA-binding transcriptional ArsR family regulator
MTEKQRGQERGSGGRGAPALRANVAELRALAHPLRLRILELFAEAPRTTMQVAELLGQPPTRLYHHVNALERSGLLRLRETRPNRGTIEKWYEAVAQRFHASRTPGKRAPPALALAVAEQARRELTSALAQRRGPRPMVARLVAPGPPARIALIRRRLQAFLQDLQREGATTSGSRLARPPPDPRHERWALTLTFAPAWPSANV